MFELTGSLEFVVPTMVRLCSNAMLIKILFLGGSDDGQMGGRCNLCDGKFEI